MQPELPFSGIIMPDHNRNGNDAAYQAAKEHFKSQTEIVLSHLEAGEEVTSDLMYQKHRITDTRARIYSIKKTLKGTGRFIEERRIPGANGAKGWKLRTI